MRQCTLGKYSFAPETRDSTPHNTKSMISLRGKYFNCVGRPLVRAQPLWVLHTHKNTYTVHLFMRTDSPFLFYHWASALRTEENALQNSRTKTLYFLTINTVENLHYHILKKFTPSHSWTTQLWVRQQSKQKYITCTSGSLVIVWRSKSDWRMERYVRQESLKQLSCNVMSNSEWGCLM